MLELWLFALLMRCVSVCVIQEQEYVQSELSILVTSFYGMEQLIRTINTGWGQLVHVHNQSLRLHFLSLALIRGVKRQ